MDESIVFYVNFKVPWFLEDLTRKPFFFRVVDC